MTECLLTITPVSCVCATEREPWPMCGQVAWSRIRKWMAASGLRDLELANAFGIASAGPGGTVSYTACVEVVEADELAALARQDLKMRRLPGGIYLNHGRIAVDKRGTELAQLRAAWTTTRMLVVDEARPVLERYHRMPRSHEVDAFDILLPLMPAGAAKRTYMLA